MEKISELEKILNEERLKREKAEKELTSLREMVMALKRAN